MDKKKKFSLGLILIAVLLVICLILNMLLAEFNDTISQMLANEGGQYGDYSTEEIYQMGREVNIEQEEEGAVLLKNDDTLPLGNKKVTILGFYSYAYIMGNGSGASAGYAETDLTMLDAFKDAGIDVNDSAWTTLRTATAKAAHVNKAVTAAGNQELSVDKYESNFTASVLGSYTDVAVITISRLGGEGTTLSIPDLQLTDNEKDLLKWADDNFKQVVVLVNSPSAMELGDVEEYADAILWIGTTGAFGMQGVANLLAGKLSPSGRTVDTWAYDMTTAPAMYNVNDNKYENYDDYGYYQYEEGIYVGYRWYETAYATGFWDSDYAKTTWGVEGYDDVVQYPFGYGLSYTTVTQEIKESDIKLEAGGTNSITVTVKNTGDVAGKEVVQIYMRAPYNQDTNCGINDTNGTRVPLEKADKVLVGFAKTGELAAQTGSEDVTITFETDNLASYDVFGHNCYVLEMGDYEFIVGGDSHEELDKTEAITLDKTIVYNEDGAGARSSDKVVATNRLDDVTAGDGVYSANLAEAYLSRSNFERVMSRLTSAANALQAANGTAADKYTDDEVPANVLEILQLSGSKSATYTYNVYENGKLTTKSGTYYLQGALDEAYAQTNYFGESSDSDKYKVTTGDSSKLTASGLTLEDLIGVDYDDEKWDAFLDAITIEELITWQQSQDKTTPSIASIGLAQYIMKDGACQVGADNKLAGSTWFACAGITAATWNVELVEKLGTTYGYQAVYYNTLGVYAPSMNLHRTPLGGRNIEYYSEDGVLSGIIGAAHVTGIQSTGVMVYLKHCLLNDNDTNRSGAITWVSEQAFRELYAVPYEISIKEGGADGIMAALNRVGMTWAHPGFYLSILRNEWGWNGFAITDMATAGGTYMSPNVGALSGLAMMKSKTSVIGNSANDGVSKASELSNYSVYMLREVAHHGLYQFVNSHMFDAPAYEPNTTWQIGWIIGDVVIAAGIVLIYIFLVHKGLVEIIKQSKNKPKTEKAVKESNKDDDEDDDD